MPAQVTYHGEPGGKAFNATITCHDCKLLSVDEKVYGIKEGKKN